MFVCDDEETMSYDKSLYKEFEMAPIPDDIPELGVKAGTLAVVIDETYPGRFVIMELAGEEGEVLDLIDVVLEPEPHVIGRWRLNEE